MKSLFFFGSGADSDYCDKLKSGQSFVEALLISKFKAEAEKLNGDDFKSYRLIYPSSTKVYLQTISAYPNEARKVIDESTVEMCLNYVKKNNDATFKDIKDRCTEWYRIITDETISNSVKDFFLHKAVFFDSLDEKFNSLRLTELNDGAKRVIDAYTQVFILMLKSVYDLDAEFPWSYDAVFQKLNEPYDLTDDNNNSSYYCALKSSRLKSIVVTTNYTSLAEKKTERYTIYLHGKLTWFEDLKKLTVFDCTNIKELQLLKEADRVLPFILIPSGVKPLICPKQIKEFARFIEELRDTDTLVVVGYKFNSEDNHINSIIADWLRNTNGKMIYLNYKDEVEFSDLNWASELQTISFDNFDKKTMDQIKKKKIISISTDANACNDVFMKVLSYLEEEY